MTIWGLRLALHIGCIPRQGRGLSLPVISSGLWTGTLLVVQLFSGVFAAGWIALVHLAPLLAVPYFVAEENPFGLFDVLALFAGELVLLLRLEETGSWQQFKANPATKVRCWTNDFGSTRVIQTTLAMLRSVGHGLLSVASGSYWPMIGPLLMTGLIIQVSEFDCWSAHWWMLSEYRDYVERTSAFIPAT